MSGLGAKVKQTLRPFLRRSGSVADGGAGESTPRLSAAHESRRERLGRHLAGDGLELGPGHQPYRVPTTVTSVTYVDRLEPTEHEELFPELGDAPGFPDTDINADFDIDGLSPIETESQDFVIASHVLEHVANPLRFLGEIHRVLRPGGIALILLPDKRRTFDVRRETTTLAHLVDHYEAGTTDVDDDHIREFVINTQPVGWTAEDSEWDKLIEMHRQRSIHVHCWTEEDFPEVLTYSITDLGQRWELVEAQALVESDPDCMEFGYVLRRSDSKSLSQAAFGERFAEHLATSASG